MVLFFTGTGNSRYIAERIAEALGDEFLSMNDRIKAGEPSPVASDERLVIPGGITDLAAAGHHKPRLFCIRKARFNQPVTHNARNAPRVGGRDDNQALIGCDR